MLPAFEVCNHLSRNDARALLHDIWYGGKNSDGAKIDIDHTSNDDGTGYVVANLPLAWIEANSAGIRFDGTVDEQRARRYADARITTPVHLRFGSRALHRNAVAAYVLDGGHRVSAARMRGDRHITVIMQTSHLQNLLRVQMNATSLVLDPMTFRNLCEAHTAFADSLVSNSNGALKLIYHGTRRSFDHFEPAHPRGAIGNPRGIYFTTDLDEAREYAHDSEGAWDDRSRIIAAVARINDTTHGQIRDREYRGQVHQEIVVYQPENVRIIQANYAPARLKTFTRNAPSLRF